MELIKQQLHRNFIIALKSNRLVALSQADKQSGNYINIDSLQPEQQTVEVWFKELDFPLLLVKQVFKNEDDTVGELYLACSDLNLSYEQITTIYKKRWGVEVYHKSVKSNASFAKSPTKTVKTQTNHFILAILGYVKLELLYLRKNKNHFAMKQIIYQAATKAANEKLKELFTTVAA
jgi:Archaeal putative transposase ISC1217